MLERRKKSTHVGIKISIKQQSNDKNKTNNSNVKFVATSKIGSDQEDLTEDSHKIRLFNELSARKNPFADLVRISLLLNPREFELPEDYIPDIQFPGTSKKPATNTATREGRHTSYSVRRAQELDRNNLPLILRTCYFCKKGCRKAPLIHCDYCPLVYHADCIDPPLTVLPNTRWMCPNHVEPVAEEKLLSSSSFCERVKLWNHFSKPIDHESIKISFLDKVHQDTDPDQSEGSEFTRLGCRVPKRVKKEYDRFIRNLETYDGESEDETSEKLSPVDEMKDTQVTNNNDERYDSTINIALKHMIESSKLLESHEYRSENGDNALI